MASRKFEDLHPTLQPIAREFLARADEQGIDVLIYCTYRSNEEQDALYARGRTVPGPRVTNARGGQSAHNFTLDGKPASKAFDFVPIIHGKPEWSGNHPVWKTLGIIGMDLGLNWYGAPGSKFYELNHFQLKT